MFRLGILVLALVLAACNLDMSGDATATVIAPVEDAGSMADGDFVTYVEPRAGIAFDYPRGWSIVEPPPEGIAYSISVASFDLNAPPENKQQEGITQGIKVDVSVAASGTSIADVRQTMQQSVTEGSVQIVKEQQRLRADGSPMTYLSIIDRFQTPATVFLTEVNGHTITVAGYGDENVIEQIAASLRPAN